MRFLVDLGLGKGEDDGSGIRCSRDCVVACASHLLLCGLWPGFKGMKSGGTVIRSGSCLVGVRASHV